MEFASGIKHSGFIHTLGVVEGTGEPRIFVLPVEQATLIDNWDVMGLRATGSIDYEIDSVFVPEHFSHFAVTETPERGGDLYRLGIIGFAGDLPLGLGAGHRAAPASTSWRRWCRPRRAGPARWARTRASRRASRAPRASAAPRGR